MFICLDKSASDSQLIGNGFGANDGTVNSFRFYRCNDTYNKLNNIKVDCADDNTFQKEVKRIVVISNEISFNFNQSDTDSAVPLVPSVL